MQTVEPSDLLKLEYAGSDPEILKAIADAEALMQQAGKLLDRVQAASYTRNRSEEAYQLKEELMDVRWTALAAVARARKLIAKEQVKT